MVSALDPFTYKGVLNGRIKYTIHMGTWDTVRKNEEKRVTESKIYVFSEDLRFYCCLHTRLTSFSFPPFSLIHVEWIKDNIPANDLDTCWRCLYAVFPTSSIPLADSRGGGGARVVAVPLLGSKNFCKRFYVFDIFLCLFYKSLLLSTIN